MKVWKIFKTVKATVKFIETIDWLFDILNSRNPYGKGFKKPLTRDRLAYLKPIISEKMSYLFNLSNGDNKKIVKTGRKTFICGFGSAVKSILHITENIFNDRQWYKYILTYRFSQDHLELFFAKIRSRHGHNNNPNVLQFKYAFRQILMRNSIKINSTSLNCLELDSDPRGEIFDIVWKKKRKICSYVQ